MTVKEVCKRITERSSYSKGELEGCIGEFLLEIVNVLNEGNIVQMGDLGNFRMSLKTATATATEKEFKASCIEKGKVLFYPGSDLRKLCKTLDFALYKSDGKPESGDEPLPDVGMGDQPGGGSGDDGDEAPDPTVYSIIIYYKRLKLYEKASLEEYSSVHCDNCNVYHFCYRGNVLYGSSVIHPHGKF